MANGSGQVPHAASITGNKKATGKKPKYARDLVQRIRYALLAAMDILEAKGKPIKELLAQELEANPAKFIELASKYCPKDLNIEIDDLRNNADQFSDGELADIAAGSSNRAAETKTGKTQVH